MMAVCDTPLAPRDLLGVAYPVLRTGHLSTEQLHTLAGGLRAGAEPQLRASAPLSPKAASAGEGANSAGVTRLGRRGSTSRVPRGAVGSIHFLASC